MIYVPVEGLHAVWPAARQHVERAKRKLGDAVQGEAIYHALRTGLASLWVVPDAADVRGVLVLQRLIDPDGSVVLFVWLVAGDLADRQHDLVYRLEQVARGMGAQKIRQHSTRRGWVKAMRGYFKPISIIYEHEV